MAADLAAPVREVDTIIPFDPVLGIGPDMRRLFPYEPIDPLDRMLDLEDGLPE